MLLHFAELNFDNYYSKEISGELLKKVLFHLAVNFI